MIEIYGIPNCDTVKKALSFLKNKEVAFEFHNFKTEGVSDEKLKEWIAKAGLAKVVNKASTTYKSLDDSEKINLEVIEKAIPLIQRNTSIIKRPVLEFEEQLLFGFKAETYTEALGIG